MEMYDVVRKLVGAIEPVGETTADERRFDNIKELTELVERLLSDINEVAWRYRNNHQYSMKRASRYAQDFIDNLDVVAKLKARLEAAEDYISKSPCDHDITDEQIKAYDKWQNFKKDE